MTPAAHASAPVLGFESADSEYEDLLGHWSDLESALSMVLGHPRQVSGFAAKVQQCDLWLQNLVTHDTDAALYLMFQLAATSMVGYSTAHALVCGTLCHLLSRELSLPGTERDALVRAALTMNIGMTALQDQLALQRTPLSGEQRQVIAQHSQAGAQLLRECGVSDPLWLSAVQRHHDIASDGGNQPLAARAPAERLAWVLLRIDRYAAMISPRKSREGRSVTESIRAIVGQDSERRDEVGMALVRATGLCPPGTMVRLDNGEVAVVLRRSAKVNHPMVAGLLDAQGKELTLTTFYHTALPQQPRIQSALAQSAVTVELNHRTMVRVGMYAAHLGDMGAR
ncbi:hypothetical protein GCM10022279_28020 [Comamonas faecalis]|uniref:HD-GYP domain-containing protein n=1 Tax=Comamonas faecalis TaxID=1387849 RepID=A0ABP7RUR2_9BURK